MDELVELSVRAFDRYYKALHTTGYSDYSSVLRLLVLTFLEELMSGEMAFFVTENDYNIIKDCIYCLSDSDCKIDYPEFPNYYTVSNLIKNANFRISNEDSLRYSGTNIRTQL